MYSVIPAESYAQAFQMVCCFFTIIAAFASYILTMRF
jgi:hypothetical protein